MGVVQWAGEERFVAGKGRAGATDERSVIWNGKIIKMSPLRQLSGKKSVKLRREATSDIELS